jgi:phospholipase C
MSFLRIFGVIGCTCSMLWLSGCGGGTSSSTTPPPTPPGNFQLQVQAAGSGTGTISSTPSGISCGKTCNATFQQGTQVTLTATPGAGSTFAGWGGACSGMDTCTITLSKNMSVTASFAPVGTPQETLSVTLDGTGTGSVTSSPPGINCGTMCGASFPQGTKVTLTETATNGSTFAGWGAPCSGSGSTCTVTLSQNTSVTASFNPPSPPPMETLTVNLAGAGTGTVASSPGGITCPGTCMASFVSGTMVTLTATPNAPSSFGGWSNGPCSGTNTMCQLTLTTNTNVTATFNTPGLSSINHIIFFSQENRSFDSYFGAMRAYWAANGIPDQSFDGLPQFNPTTGIAPLYGPPPTNPGCNPNDPPPADCSYDPSNPVTSYHLITQCIENPSPFWNEAHVDWDYNDQTDTDTYQGNGFVWAAGHDSRADNYYDVNGVRVMGYYDWTDLNYYYFMATDFATSDRWFNPIMTRTEPNRDYIMAATSHGYVYPIGSNGEKDLPDPPIFAELQNAGISWKIYVNPATTCQGPPYQTSCLISLSYIQGFTWQSNIQYPTNIGTIGPAGTCGSSPCDFENDLANGTLPQVVFIEPASDAGLDEHGSDYDMYPINIQLGAKYVSGIINSVMTSQYWTSSAIIFTYDEYGGIYDHVSPQTGATFPNPDGIAPSDLKPTDICYGQSDVGTCNFNYSGYRVPAIVISPYAKKNYVSHTPRDTTSWLNLVEERFNLAPLTARDKAQPPMDEFFDFTNPPWLTPPSPPAQLTNGACYLNKLP